MSRSPVFDFTIPIEPSPASRPKVSRYGTRYSKSHMAYKTACLDYLSTCKFESAPVLTGRLTVHMVFVCTKARTSKLITPRYDIDNLVKLPLDCMTTSGLFWKDDVQVSKLIAVKQFAAPDEHAHTTIQVYAHD